MPSGHEFFTMRTKAVNFVNFVSWVYIFYNLLLPDEIIKRLGFTIQEKEIDVDEDLPHIFETLTIRNAQIFVQTNGHMMQRYGFEFQDPDTVEALDKIKFVPRKAMTGAPFYHLMSNADYVEDFCYIGPEIKEREKLIEDGYEPDMVESGKFDSKGQPIMEISESSANARTETSDMVMILLNLAYIPDQVAGNIDFTPGWSLKFKENMEAYKQEWA